MKKFLVLLFLMSVGTSAFAQKSYLNVAAIDLWQEQSQYITLSGDVPSDLKWYYHQTDDNMSIGNLLNILSEKGFVVEYMCSLNSGTGSDRGVNYLLSRNKSNDSDAIQHIKAYDGEEAYEVARYNPQGLPVSKNEKGIQIVVYSNYTTKTIIVE
jgi:hypothetical protein